MSAAELTTAVAIFRAKAAIGIDVEPPIVAGYRILRGIGKGAFGRVFCARDLELDRDVAIKLTKPREGSELAEARALAKLNHPNVVHVYEAGEDDGLVFTAMELIDGERLDDWAATGPTIDERLDVLHQVARGLAAIHEAGLAHKDVKPSNILVADGRAVIVDLGLAHATGAVGTRGWAAPEVVAGAEADARADQYSFGLVVRWMLEGKKLGEKFCARALEQDPEKRWESMASGVAAIPPRRPRRGRTAAIITAIAIAVTVAWGAGVRRGERDGLPELPEWTEHLIEIDRARELAEAGQNKEAYRIVAEHRASLLAHDPAMAAIAVESVAVAAAKSASEDQFAAELLEDLARETWERAGVTRRQSSQPTRLPE